MELLQAILLGLLQGLTEWLPISSSGQAILALTNLSKIQGMEALNISFFLHLGSLFAVFIYFRKEIIEILRLKSPYLRFIIYSTIATGIVGLPIYFKLENFLYGNEINKLVGISLIITGIILRFSKERGSRDISNYELKDALFAGIAQGFAIIPGISRSGVTVATLLSRRFLQQEALTISFLMAIPAIIGANVLSLSSHNITLTSEIFAGLLASLLSSLVGIKFLLEISKRLRFDLFCIFFGAIAALI